MISLAANSNSLEQHHRCGALEEEERPMKLERCWSWQEFCDSCAKFAAYDFAQSWHNYLAENGGVVEKVSEQEASSKFVEAFVGYFENEARRICRSSRLLNESIISSASHPLFCAANYDRNEVSHAQYVNSLCSSESDSVCSSNGLSCEFDLKKRRSVFARLSYKSLKRALLKRSPTTQCSYSAQPFANGKPQASLAPPPSPPPPSSRKRGKSATTAKTIVEVVHESGCSFVCGRDLDGERWEKGRVVLVKTVGGYLLEFYAPAKASKPKSGIFCFLLTEVRETTALETPDCSYTFVLKAENFKEYIVQVKSHKQMKEWLSIISSCMGDSLCASTTLPPTPGVHLNATLRSKSESGLRFQEFNSLPLRGSSTGSKSQSRLSSLFGGRESRNGSSGQLFSVSHLRRSYSSGQASNPTTCVRRNLRSTGSALLNSLRGLQLSTGAIHDFSTCPYGILRVMDAYPWFHGSLSRADATALVVQSGVDGHGLFLVRQSETRSGEYVLTFNCHGRAKHLRITVLARGHCRVQHLWFDSVFDMLEHFRTHHIPLQTSVREIHCSSGSGVFLTDYVIAWPPNQPTRSRTSPPDPRNYVTHGGSIRVTTSSLERLAIDHPQNHLLRNGRAENTYQFT